jgi:hypothetical protein
MKAAFDEIERITQDLHAYHIKISHLPIPRMALDLLASARHTLRAYKYLLDEQITRNNDRIKQLQEGVTARPEDSPT